MKGTAVLLVSLLSLITACSAKLDGTTWKAEFQGSSVTLDFVSSDTVKSSWKREGNDGVAVTNTSELAYSVEGKTVYLKGPKATRALTMENNELVGRPIDFGLEPIDSTARVAAQKQKQ